MLIKILIVIFTYLFGSIPTAYLLFKVKKGGDIRKYGDGNVGGTNVIKTIGTWWGIFIIIIDILKGFLPILAVFFLYPEDYILLSAVAITVVLGHILPIYIKFKGGKAIATGFGVIIGISALPFILEPTWLRILPPIIILGIWVIVIAIIRVVSIGSLVAVISIPIAFHFTGYPWAVVVTGIFFIIITYITHHKNIKRLVGT